MESVDVGSLPAEEVLDFLLEGEALKKLLAGHGAACFVLVRPMVAPGFFRALIQNSPTIDATTRQHVAFIVFYGNKSRLRCGADAGYGPHGDRCAPVPVKMRLDGLSISGDPEHTSFEVPVRTPGSDAKGLPQIRDTFSKRKADLLRFYPEQVDEHMLSHHMSRVATRLMEIYKIPESDLPCLLFTAGEDLSRHLVVPLNPENPLQSLYSDALKTLSGQFSSLSRVWRSHLTLAGMSSAASQSKAKYERLMIEISALKVEIDLQLKAVAEKAQSIEAEIAGIAKRVDEKVASLPQKVSKQLQKVRDFEGQVAGGSGRQDWLFKERQRLAAYGGAAIRDEIQEENELRKSLGKLKQIVPKLMGEQTRLESQVLQQKKILSENSPQRVQQVAREIELLREQLHGEGYGHDILRVRYPSAFSAIEVMVQKGLLGFRRPRATESPGKQMRILFLAANPTTTRPLDLEQELRSLEQELRAVRYRDQIELRTGHAVQPDDLVRLVRDFRPTVVHFSGHGGPDGIVFRDEGYGDITVMGPSLSRFFSGRGVDLLVLNACYSRSPADHLHGAVDAVVGTTDRVGDVAARRFSAAFYRSLGDGHSIREAFRDGTDAVVLDNKSDVFWMEGEVDRKLVTSPGE